MQQEKTAITSLHDYLIRAVPQVRLPITAALHDRCQITEIGDARDLILHHMSVRLHNARDEAHYRYRRAGTNHTLQQTGLYTPNLLEMISKRIIWRLPTTYTS